jgi:hypothetical protein
MGKSNKTFKYSLIFASAAFLIVNLWVSLPVSAAKTVTLCNDKSTLEGLNGLYKAGASKKLKTDGTPLFASYTTTSNSPVAASRSAELVLIPAPAAGCSFDKIVINTDATCHPLEEGSHPVEVRFTGCSNSQNVYYTDVEADADALTPANGLENTYNALRSLTMMDHLPNLPAECSNPGSEQDLKDCAGVICNNIKNEVENGDKNVQRNAGNIMQLIGDLQANSWVCFARSGEVEVNSGLNGCDIEDIIRTGGIEALTMAPAINRDANIFSDGAGLLQVMLNDTGSFASIDMASCVADFLNNE